MDYWTMQLKIQGQSRNSIKNLGFMVPKCWENIFSTKSLKKFIILF